MSENATGKIVSRSMNIYAPPSFTADEEEMLRKLDDLRDEDIDFSDSPRTRDFSGFRRYPDFRDEIAGRVQASAVSEDPGADRAEVVAIAGDVLQYFKDSGDASPDRINRALREYISTCPKVA